MRTTTFRILYLADEYGPTHWTYLQFPDDLQGEHWMSKHAYNWETWSECIGAKDKHDTDIYEKDILWKGLYDKHTGKKILWVVDFQRYRWVLVPLRIWDDMEYCGGGFTPFEYQYPVPYEIVGNNWERPE